MNTFYIILGLGILSSALLLGMLFFLYKWLMYKINTPADLFLQAKRTKKPMGIRFHQTGMIDFVVSENSINITKDNEVSNIAPNSSFIEYKSKVSMSAMYIAPGISGQTIDPNFLTFTNEVNRIAREKNISKEDAIEEILTQQKDKGQVHTVYGNLSFANVGEYINYNDTVGNYNSANNIAAAMGGLDKKILKWIVILIAGGLAITGVIVVVWLLLKFGQTPELTIDMSAIKAGLENAINNTNTTIVTP